MRTAEQIKDDARVALRETIEAAEAAAILGVSEWTIYDLARRKILPHVRVGTRRVLFRRTSILAWLDAQEQVSMTVDSEPAGKVRRLT
ncbi:MAG: helix-turn-helix transcriptional regulator [Eubacteriales bacterium]